MLSVAPIAAAALGLGGPIAQTKASAQIVVGRLNVNRREFWLFSGDASPRRILSDSLVPVFERKTMREFPGAADYLHAMLRCAVSPDGTVLLTCDSVLHEGKELWLELSLAPVRGSRRTRWKARVDDATSVSAGYLRGKPGLIILRGDGLDRVSFRPWGSLRERPLARSELPPFLALVRPEGLLYDDPLDSSQWTLVSGEFHGRSHREHRSTWLDRPSLWTVGPTALRNANGDVPLPEGRTQMRGGLQIGPRMYAGVILTGLRTGNGSEGSAFRSIGLPSDIWLCYADRTEHRWSRLTEGESVAIVRIGDGEGVRNW